MCEQHLKNRSRNSSTGKQRQPCHKLNSQCTFSKTLTPPARKKGTYQLSTFWLSSTFLLFLWISVSPPQPHTCTHTPTHTRPMGPLRPVCDTSVLTFLTTNWTFASQLVNRHYLWWLMAAEVITKLNMNQHHPHLSKLTYSILHINGLTSAAAI